MCTYVSQILAKLNKQQEVCVLCVELRNSYLCHSVHARLLPLLRICTPHRVQTLVHRELRDYQLGTWNMRSVVDTDGSVEVASQTGRGESRKVDQIIHAMGQ